jgi:ABC-type maltose transport system permease subunit
MTPRLSIPRALLRNKLGAMGALALIPVFALFFLFQKYLVEGISTTGLKG